MGMHIFQLITFFCVKSRRVRGLQFSDTCLVTANIRVIWGKKGDDRLLDLCVHRLELVGRIEDRIPL